MIEKEEMELMEQRIQQFNEFVMAQDIEKMPIGLFSGKIGLAIYFYHQAGKNGDKKYGKFASELIDSIYAQLHNRLPINIENGLIGICKGIIYLVENGFIQGNPNYILKDLENEIFSKLYFECFTNETGQVQRDSKVAIHCALYFCERLTDSKLSKINRSLYERIVIKTINHIETIVISNKMTEPYLFSRFDYFIIIYLELISKVFELGFYDYKVYKVCDEWNELILSSIPLLASHRLLFAFMLERVNRYYNSRNWDKHIYLLQHNTEIDYVIDIDFRNKNLYVFNGMSGIVYFLNEMGAMTDNNREKICAKIVSSELWVDFDKSNDIEKLSYVGLMNGLAGVIHTYCQMNNRLTK